jgi:hypothetical protein
MEVGGQRHAPAPLSPEKTRYPWNRGWVSSRAGLDGCGKSRPHRDSIPGPSSLLYNYLNKLNVGKTVRSGFNNYASWHPVKQCLKMYGEKASPFANHYEWEMYQANFQT